MKFESLALASFLAIGCTPGPESSSGEGTDSSDSGSSTHGASESTVGETDPGQTSDGTATEGMDTTAGTETGEPDECAFPPPEAIECQPPGATSIDFALSVDGTPLEPYETLELDELCTLSGSTDDGATTTLQLTCPTGAIDLEISSTPHQVLEIGDGTELALFVSFTQVDEANVGRRVTVRWGQDGPLAFAAFDDTGLPSAAELDVSPIELALPPTTCEPYIDGEFGISIQPAGLRVTYDGTTADVFEHGDAYVGQLTSYRVLTGDLRRIHCFPPDAKGYNYANWFVRAMLFQIPEG